MKRLNVEYQKLKDINKEIYILWHSWYDKKISNNSYNSRNEVLFSVKRRIIADIETLFEEIHDKGRTIFISRL